MHRYLIAAIFLSACVPVVDRADCTDGDVRKDNCDRNRITRTIVDNPPQPEPEPEPEPEEPGGHWATRENEPDSRTDPDGHRDWQRDRDAQIEEGTWR